MDNQQPTELRELRIMVDLLSERVLALAVENQTLQADMHAQRSMIWACLATSPEAMAFAEKERPVFRASLVPLQLNALQTERAVDVMQRLLVVARSHQRGLPGAVRQVWHDLLVAAECAANPFRWTRRGALMVLGVCAVAWLLYFSR